MKLNITIDNYFTTPSIHEANRACLAKNPERKIVKLHLTKYQKEQLFHAMGISIHPHRSKIQILKEFFQEKFKWHKRQLRVLKGPLKINQPKVFAKTVRGSQSKIDNPIRSLITVAVSIKDKQIDNEKFLESGDNTSVHPHSQKLFDAGQLIGLSSDLIHSDADDQLSSVSSHPRLMSANSTDSTQQSIGYPQMSETTKQARLMSANSTDSTQQSIGYPQMSEITKQACLMSANSTDSTQQSGYPQMSETTKQALLQPMENSQLGSPEIYGHYVPNEVSLPENLQSKPTLQENPATKFSAKTAKGLAISTAAFAAPLAISGAAGYALYLVAAAHPIVAAATVIGVTGIGVYWAAQRVKSWFAGN